MEIWNGNNSFSEKWRGLVESGSSGSFLLNLAEPSRIIYIYISIIGLVYRRCNDRRTVMMRSNSIDGDSSTD